MQCNGSLHCLWAVQSGEGVPEWVPQGVLAPHAPDVVPKDRGGQRATLGEDHRLLLGSGLRVRGLKILY